MTMITVDQNEEFPALNRALQFGCQTQGNSPELLAPAS